MRSGGQAMVELAVCMPVVLVLGLGVTAVVEAVDAGAGLRAATESAVAAAARAPDGDAARSAAQARFAAVIAGYPVRGPSLVIAVGVFARGAPISATGTGFVDLGWVAMALVPKRLSLQVQATATVEAWRTR